MRRILKDRRGFWPKPWQLQVPLWSKKQQREVTGTIYMMLPHSIVGHWLQKVPDVLPKLLPTASRSPEFLPLCDAVARELRVGEGQIVPLGLHGDGVPFDSQRTRSLELLHLNFPATGSPLRVPLVGAPKEFFVKGKTYQALLELVAWSLKWCAMGQHPPALPDGTPFVDRQAAALAGQPLGCRAALLEVRADWQFLKICFGFPAWNEKAGCCWLCEATPGAPIRHTGPDALWRKQRLEGLQALLRMRDRGQEVSPLFGAPGLRPVHFVPDWLRVVDLGVAPTILGHLLHFAIAKAPWGQSGIEGPTLALPAHRVLPEKEPLQQARHPDTHHDQGPRQAAEAARQGCRGARARPFWQGAGRAILRPRQRLRGLHDRRGSRAGGHVPAPLSLIHI